MPAVQVNGDLVIVQSGSYSAQDIRRPISNAGVGPGPIDYASFRVSQASGLTLNFGVGSAYVRQPVDGTLYRVSQDGVAGQITLTGANGTNPRVDQVILRIYDGAVDGSNQYTAQVETIDGTPTAGATLDNMNGAPDPHTALQNSSAYIPLANVLVPANATSVAGNIRNRRPIGQRNMVPPLDAVGGLSLFQSQFEPSPGLVVNNRQFLGSDIASKQSAALMYLGTRGAFTKVHWQYYCDVITAGVKNYNIAFADAAGRIFAQTGAFAWAPQGANGIRRETITLTLPYAGFQWDIGAYYVLFCNGTGFSATDSIYANAAYSGSPASTPIATVASAGNMFLASPSGGTNAPTELGQAGTAYLDMGVSGATTANCPVPVVTLST